MKIFLLFLILVVFLSGCTVPDIFNGDDGIFEQGIKINVEADPNTVFSGSNTVVFVDVENTDEKPLRDVDIYFYYLDLFEVSDSYLPHITYRAHDMNTCQFLNGSCSLTPCPPGRDMGTCKGGYRDEDTFDWVVPPGAGPDYCCARPVGPDAQDPDICDYLGGQCVESVCDDGMYRGRCDIGDASYMKKPWCCGLPCFKRVLELDKDGFVSYSCELTAPDRDELLTSSYSASVGVGVKFRTTFYAVQQVKLITEQGYELRSKTADWVTEPKIYIHKDKNLEVQVDFSDNLPIIVREGKDAYIYFTIRNIGGGYINDIKKREFSIYQSPVNGFNVVDCSGVGDLAIRGNEFPRIACRLNLPEDMDYLSNYPIIILIDYTYENREEVPITVVK